MPDCTFATADLTTFARLDTLGLQVTGQFLEPDRAVLACRVIGGDVTCGRCGEQGRPRDSTTRRLAHEPFGWRPTILLVTVRRYRCDRCRLVWRQDTSAVAEPRARLSRGALRWALTALVCQHLTVARIAEALGVSWNTANDAVLAEGRRVLIADPHRFDGVKVIGVDEHVWRHTRRGDRYVTVVIDLTPVRDRTGPARLLDMVEGRSKQVFKTWLSARDETWRNAIEVVAMDGFTGFKTAAIEELKDEVTVVMDPFHVVRLAGQSLELCRRRVQQQTLGHRGRAGDPLYSARRTLSTGADLLTDKQRQRISALFADDAHLQVEATWGVTRPWSAPTVTPIGLAAKPRCKPSSTPWPAASRLPWSRSERSAGPSSNGQPMSWPISTGRAPATDRPKRSTVASSTSAGPPSAFGTSPTTSPDRC